jgi:AbrB family looped-hinge helix DNA binding protein
VPKILLTLRRYHAKIIDINMDTVTMSDNYQIVIPKEVRNTIGVEAGTSFEIMVYANRIELIPIGSMQSLKGIFKGIDTTIVRNEDRLWTS